MGSCVSTGWDIRVGVVLNPQVCRASPACRNDTQMSQYLPGLPTVDLRGRCLGFSEL